MDGPKTFTRPEIADEAASQTTPPNLNTLPNDCNEVLFEFFRLDERWGLANTCRACRKNEQEEEAHIESRKERMRRCVAETRALRTDESFQRLIDEFGSAGDFGAPVLPELVPMASPYCSWLEPDNFCDNEYHARIVRSVAPRLIPFLDVKGLAKKAADTLTRFGNLPLDVKIVLYPDSFAADDARNACMNECEALFMLSLLGPASVPYVRILLQKVLPPFTYPDAYENLLDEVDEWDSILVGIDPHTIPTISRMAVDVLKGLEEHLCSPYTDSITNFLRPRISNKVDGFQVPIATYILSQLWGALKDHDIAERALEYIPTSDSEAYESINKDNTFANVRCQLIAAAGATQHANFLIWSLRFGASCVSEPAVEALRLISPLLSKSEHEEMVMGVFRTAHPMQVQVDGLGCIDADPRKTTEEVKEAALGLLVDLACSSHGHWIEDHEHVWMC